MTKLSLENISKIYENGFKAVKDVSVQINDGEFLVLVGPSGCGKSTLLRMIAGLEEISDGNLILDNKVINKLTSKDREIGMVFQNYALYPHMTVYDNLAYPLRIVKTKKELIKKRVDEVAEMVSISELLDRYPKQLSGGQRQRVALGRAIAKSPKIFLFDEPLSNLDAKLRVKMRTEITSIHRKNKGISIYVTHDQTEAMTMADKLVVLNHGLVQQIGTPEEVYHDPNNRFVAEFLGSPKINMWFGSVKNKMFSNETINFDLDLIDIQNAHFAYRPEDIEIDNEGQKVKVVNVENLGHECLIYFEFDGVHCLRTNNRNIIVGEEIIIKFVNEKVLIFDDQGNRVRT